MALENIFFTVRAGFNASIECLISDTTSSPTWLGSNVIPTPTGDANPVSVGPDVTGATEALSNSIPLPEGWDIENIDINQLFNCLPDNDTASVHVSSFSDPSVLPLDNLRVKIIFKTHTNISIDVYPYSLEPNIVEVTPLVRTIAYIPDYWIDPSPASYTLTGYTLVQSYIYQLTAVTGAFTLTGIDATITPSTYRLTAFTGQYYAAEPGVLYKPMIHVRSLSTYSYDNTYQDENGITDGSFWISSGHYSGFYGDFTHWRTIRHDNLSGKYFQSGIGTQGAYGTTYWNDQRNYRKPGTDYGYEVALLTYGSSSNTGDQILWAYFDSGSNPPMSSEPDLYFDDPFACIDHVVIRDNYICVGYSGYLNSSTIDLEWRHPKKLEPDTWYWITFEVYQGRGNIAIDGEFCPIDFKGITNDWQNWRFARGNNGDTLAYDGYSFDWYWYLGNKRRGKNFTAPQPWLATTNDDTSRPNWAEAIEYVSTANGGTGTGIPETVVFTYIPA